MRSIALACLLPAILLSGCGQRDSRAADPEAPAAPAAPAASATATTTAGPTGDVSGIERPPPFRIRYDDRELVLHPHTYCYGGGCVDGAAVEQVEVGAPDELRIHVPVERFDLEVSLTEAEPGVARCSGRSFTAPVEDLGGGWYALRPFGPAATYIVGLFASGGGDMIAEARWTMPAGTAMPAPSARLALIADHDGRPDSYGLELAIDDLAATPRRATARVEVSAANGRSATIAPRLESDSCTGDLYFTAPRAEAEQAAALGGFPFTTTVTLTLDGTTHTATAVYPDDEIEDNEPSVRLVFDPPLPGL